MARNGEFPEQWCAKMGVAMSTMFNWAARYPEFDEACRIAWTALSAYWTGELVKAARGNNCNTRLLLELLRRRFPDTWGSNAKNGADHFISCVDVARSTKVDQQDYDDMTSDELMAEIAALSGKSG